METKRIFLTCPHCDKKTVFTYSYFRQNVSGVQRHSTLCFLCNNEILVDTSYKTGFVMWYGVLDG